ncbi:MAG: hypothetical protein J6J74_08040 [Elusimicrobiaceae bacterium]|nr:hypothetical protein [Elusimicrobiaceae bacterium]
MSRFNEYARKADAYAKAVFEEYAEAESKLKAAESKRNAYPRKNGLGYEYDAKSARYEAEYQEAKAEYEKLRREMRDYKADGFKPIRKELESAIADAFAANPEHLDANTMELLRSGIMSADEYNRLMSKATADNNPTMVRVIAKYAKDRADQADADRNTDAARAFRAVAYKGNGVNGNSYLEAFDVMTSCFNRCMNNTALIGHWDELNGEIVENF